MKRAALPLLAILALAACQPESDAPASVGAEQVGAATPYSPSPGQEVEILAALQLLFDALETGDDALLRSVMDPSVVMHFSETRDGVTTYGSATLDGLATRITTSDVPLVERMWDPVVSVDGPLATIWTPYDFYAGTAFSHCGVDAANLLETEAGWRIVALSWTRLQPPACSLHPEGPPAN